MENVSKTGSVNDMMLIFGLNETIDQLTMANHVHWHLLTTMSWHRCKIEDEGQWRKRRPGKTLKKLVEKECVEIGLNEVNVVNFVDQHGSLELITVPLG